MNKIDMYEKLCLLKTVEKHSGLLMPQLISISILMTPQTIAFAAVFWALRDTLYIPPMKKDREAWIGLCQWINSEDEKAPVPLNCYSKVP